MSSINNGKIRNNVAELEKINDNLYENIFRVNAITNGEKSFYFYNLLNKVIFPDNLDSSLFSEAVVTTDTPWTTLSFKLYGTINLWWVLYLVNKPKYIFLAKGGTIVKYIRPQSMGTILRSITI
jgi:hypothetical protein